MTHSARASARPTARLADRLAAVVPTLLWLLAGGFAVGCLIALH